jgi:hypothetical protein
MLTWARPGEVTLTVLLGRKMSRSSGAVWPAPSQGAVTFRVRVFGTSDCEFEGSWYDGKEAALWLRW